MQKVNNVAPEKLKYLALVFAIATAGLAAALIIITLMNGVFTLGYISYVIPPVLLNAFILFVNDDQKKTWCTHNIGYIILYVYFGAWSVWGLFNTISYLSFFLSNITSIYALLTFATQVAYTLDGLVGLVYYHQLRTSFTSDNNGEPLLNA